MGLLTSLLQSRTEARGLVTPAGTMDQPVESWVSGTGAHPVSSGVHVSPRTAEGIPTVYACDKVIKQDVAKTPIRVKRRNADGSKADDTSHPIYVVLHDLANPVMTAYEFKETMQSFLNLWGNAYAEIIRDSRNNVLAVWPLDPSRMVVDLDPLNRLRYTYRMSSGANKEWIFDPANPPIFHLRQNALDGIHGRSPVTVLREAIGQQIAAERYTGRYYGQGGHPRVALTTPNKLSPDAARRVRKDYEDLTAGEHNWHRVVVMDHDLKPVPIAMTNRDAQFVDLQKLGQGAICGAFRVPPHKIAQLDRATNNNIEQQAIEYVGDCLDGHFVCWEQGIARDLLNTRSFNTHFAMFDRDSIIRCDATTLSTVLAARRQNGVINANEWRDAVGMDNRVTDQDGGNEYLVNGNMVPVKRVLAGEVVMPPSGGVH